MDFSPGARIVQRHWLTVVIIGILSAGVAFAASYLVSPSYSASTHVLVRARETRFLTSTGEPIKDTGGLDATLAKPLTQTNSGLVKSRPVAEQVVRTLGLDQPRPADSSLLGQVRSTFKHWYHLALAYAQYGFYAQATPYEAAVREVQGSLDGLPVKDSYLIEIRARAEEPEQAAGIASVATQAFIEQSRQRFQAEAGKYRAFLEKEVEAARGRVADAEQALRKYKEEKGITDISEQLKLSAGAQEDGRKQLSDTRAALDTARARQAALQAELATLDPTETSTTTVSAHNSSTAPLTTTTTTTVQTSPSTTVQETPPSTIVQETSPASSVQETPPTTSIQEAPSSVTTSESGRSRATTKSNPVTTTTRSPGSTVTTKSDGGTSTTKNEGVTVTSRSDGTTRNETTTTATTQNSTTESSEGRSSVAPNRVYQTVQSDLVAVQGEIAGLQARADSLTAALDGSVQAAGALPELQARLSELQLQVASATKAYGDLRSAYQEAVLNDERGSEDISVVNSAAVPLYPDRPLRYLFVLVGLVVGLMGGAGLAFLLDRGPRGPRSGRGTLPSGPVRPVPGPLAQPAFGAPAGIEWQPAPGAAAPSGRGQQ